MWTYAVVVGALIVACYFVLSPLLREEDRGGDPGPKAEDRLEALQLKKEGAYAAIREMEFDLNMGKLTEEDFALLKRQYLEEAAGYMKEMDALAEAEDAAPVEGKTGPEEEHDETAAAPAMAPNPEKPIYCTFCGEKARAENRFCGACGTRLEASRSEG